jgi:uncharacterized protein
MMMLFARAVRRAHEAATASPQRAPWPGRRIAPLCGTAREAAALALLALLAACGTQAPPRFHTLLPPPAAARTPVDATPALAWQVTPVQIPAQVDQPQFVVRRADDTLAQLEQERWAAPLQDEIRAALIEHLAARLGLPLAAPANGRKDWRIGIDVQRFDSTPGRSTLVVHWALAGGGSGSPVALRCRSQFEQAVEPGIAPLAAGHRKAIERLAEAIAPVLRALDAGQAPTCP